MINKQFIKIEQLALLSSCENVTLELLRKIDKEMINYILAVINYYNYDMNEHLDMSEAQKLSIIRTAFRLAYYILYFGGTADEFLQHTRQYTEYDRDIIQGIVFWCVHQVDKNIHQDEDIVFFNKKNMCDEYLNAIYCDGGNYMFSTLLYLRESCKINNIK